MRTKIYVFPFALLMSAASLAVAPGLAAAQSATNDYASNLAVVSDSQQQAVAQADQMLASGQGGRDKAPLQAAVNEMRLAATALDAAKNAPDKLPAALAAEQAAYQALLKAMPREYRMMQSRKGSQGGGGAGQASQQEMNALDMPDQQNRYETESQATAPAGQQLREQTQTADRLKELSQRQQNLNERLRELQTQLPAARTDAERDELQRQLKRLQDEQRQMLANVDELRQALQQSPGTGSQADTQQKLEQTRNDMERAAQEMNRQSASGALAAGQRAQESMKNLGDNLRKQNSSGFTDQMRQLRNEARDMTARQDEIARGLNSLNGGGYQPLDNSAARQQISRQMQQQQDAVTNLLSQMRVVTEQAETTEPLLSKQLYDTWRRADQTHTENLLEMAAQLTDRGFLPQAGQVERTTHTNITDLANGIEHAADSVLGSEADALRYAGKEIDDLTRQMERELGGADTNAGTTASGETNAIGGQANSAARTNAGTGMAPGSSGTNVPAPASGSSPGNESPLAGNNAPGQPSENPSEPTHENGDRGQAPNERGARGEQASTENSKPGQGSGQGQGPVESQSPGNNAQPASTENQPNGQGPGQAQASGGNSPGQGDRSGNRPAAGSAPGAMQAGATDGGDRLRQLAEQLGGGGGAGGLGRNGPITGNDYVSWTEHLRDVEQVVDPADLRNQLATVRERASALREDYREHGRKPDPNVVRQQIVTPLTQVRAWLQDELARKEKSDSLVPLDRDPVPDNYTELVRKYYEKLGTSP